MILDDYQVKCSPLGDIHESHVLARFVLESQRQRNTNMAAPQNTKNDKSNKNDKSATPPPAPAASASPSASTPSNAKPLPPMHPEALGKPTGRGDKKVLLWSQAPGHEDFRMRVLVSQLQEHGAPEHKGLPMIAKEPIDDNAEAKAKAKAEEKAKFDAMSEPEKLAYAKAKREEREGQRKAKKAAEREALKAELLAEIAANNAKA